MSDQQPISLLCPVCRARQVAQPQCRRCGADLVLYGKALAAAEVSKRCYAAARHRGDDQAMRRELEYLTWLSPVEAAEVLRHTQGVG